MGKAYASYAADYSKGDPNSENLLISSSFYDFVEMVNYCLALPYLPGGIEL
jgi:hypothetical protein